LIDYSVLFRVPGRVQRRVGVRKGERSMGGKREKGRREMNKRGIRGMK
jgi:hypothetical protein